MLHEGLYEKVISLGLEKELAQSDRLAQTASIDAAEAAKILSKDKNESFSFFKMVLFLFFINVTPHPLYILIYNTISVVDSQEQIIVYKTLFFFYLMW